MEGIMLVETASGALHYTRSFSDGFDVRHPKTERLNFAALIFALQNFAGSSVRSVENADGLGEGLRTRNSAEITMFNTSVENMVLTTTPSSGLLVVWCYYCRRRHIPELTKTNCTGSFYSSKF